MLPSAEAKPQVRTIAEISRLHEMWSLYMEARAGKTASDDNPHWGAENTLMGLLGLNLHETIQYIYNNGPSFDQFVQWVLDRNGGKIAPDRVEEIERALSQDGSAPNTAPQDCPLTQGDLSFWDENGYVILHDAITQEGCRAAVQAICEFLGMSLNDSDTWYNGPQGQSIWVPLLRHPAIEANRRSTRIRDAFAQIWGRTDLWMTVDQCGMNPPERPGWQFPGPHLHWDTSLHLPMPLGVQGILYLTDTAANQGAFTCVPGFHRRLETWLENLPPGSNPRQQNLKDLGAVPIAGRAGDLIIWHHALPHGSSPNTNTVPRFVQYMAMKPNLSEDSRAWR